MSAKTHNRLMIAVVIALGIIAAYLFIQVNP